MSSALSLRARCVEWWARSSWLCGAVLVAVLSWSATEFLLLSLCAMGFVLYFMAIVVYPELNLLLYYIPGKTGFEERLELGWGVSANQVFLVLFWVALLLKLFRRQRLPSFPWCTVALLAALCGLMWTGLIHSDNTHYGMFKAISYTVLVLPGIIFLGLHVDRPILLRRFLFFFFGIALGMTMLGLHHIGSLQRGDRLAVLGGGANVYSRMVGCGLLLLLTYVVTLHRRGRTRQSWFLVGTLGPCSLVAMYYAGSKGPLLALFLCFLLFAALNGFLRRTVVVIVLMLTVYFAARQKSQSFDGMMELISASRLFLNPTAEVSYGSYGSRVDHLKYSADEFVSNPLAGVGTGDWGGEQRLFEERSYPHNMFLELACELGLMGMLLVGAYCSWLAKEAWTLVRRGRDSEHHVVHVGLVLCLFFWFLNVQVSGDVVDSRNLWIFAALSEIAVRLARHGETAV